MRRKDVQVPQHGLSTTQQPQRTRGFILRPKTPSTVARDGALRLVPVPVEPV